VRERRQGDTDRQEIYIEKKGDGVHTYFNREDIEILVVLRKKGGRGKR